MKSSRMSEGWGTAFPDTLKEILMADPPPYEEVPVTGSFGVPATPEERARIASYTHTSEDPAISGFKFAQEVADALIGTSNSLVDAVGSELWLLDSQSFLNALDGLVMECACCGWWLEAPMVDDNQECEDCHECESDECLADD